MPSGSWLKGQYQILNLLGHGGFGNTYRAYDSRNHTMVAIKELYPCALVHRDRRSGYVLPERGREQVFEWYKLNFKKEAEIMYNLRKQPRILKIYELFSYGGTEYYVMQLLEGKNLKEYLVDSGRISWQKFKPVLKEVLDTMKVLHQNSYIHRDIKPDNIFLTMQGKVYLIDYGNVRDFAHSDHYTKLLTDHFAPPEQYLLEGKQGPHTDIYSLCATIYYCLSAKLPPVAPARVEELKSGREDPLIHLSKISENIPGYVSDAVDKGLQLESKKRFQTVQELEKVLFDKRIAAAEYNDERFIRCVHGMLKGNMFQIPKGKNFSIGRAADIRYPESAVGISRIQFYLYIDWMGYIWIYDPGSTNGVSVDDQRIKKEEWKQISAGQRISFVNEVYELM